MRLRPLVALVVMAVLAATCGHPAEAKRADAKPDTIAPIVLAASNAGLMNQFIPLQFTVWDNSGLAAIHVWIRRGPNVLRRSFRGWLKTGFYNWYWRPHATGSYRYCIYGIDKAGNKSQTRCTPVTIFKHWPK